MTIATLLSRAYDVVFQPLLLLLFGVTFVMFIWGVVEYIRTSDDAKGREQGQKSILWGLVGMVIMISVFGIINIIIGTIGAEPPSNAQDVQDTFKDINQIQVNDSNTP